MNDSKARLRRRFTAKITLGWLCLLAGVLPGSVSTSRAQIQFFGGSPAEASTAIPIDLNGDDTPEQMLVGDNEDEILRFYPFAGTAAAPGVDPASSFTVTSNSPGSFLGIPEETAISKALGNTPGFSPPNFNRLKLDTVNKVLNNPGPNDNWNIREADIEASARIGNRVFWMGSHSRGGDSFKERPARRRFFATDLTITGSTASLTFANYYTQLLAQLVAFDLTRPVDRRYGFQTSSGTEVDPESPAGFNIEGMTHTETAGTLFIGFRAPLVDPARTSNGGAEPTQMNRTHAIVIELKNPNALIASAGSSPATTDAAFGRTYELNLGGRGIRSMDFNGTDYVISAGRPGTPTDPDGDFALYTWKPETAPVLRSSSILDGFGAETVMILPRGSLAGAFKVRLLEDHGVTPSPDDPRSQVGSFRSLDIAVPAPGK